MQRPIKRILAGTDFSRPASNAVLRAAMLAAEHAAKLELVHVTPRLDRARLKKLGLGAFAAVSSDALLEEHLEKARALARSQGIVAPIRLLKGSAPAMLAREAARLSADLLVLGYRGERTLKDALIGTTAERVLERWTGDTLIVRNAPKAPYAAVLACVALGPASCSVVMSAVALSNQARLHILHAYGPPFELKLISHHQTGEVLAKHRAATKAEAVRGLAELLERCPVPGVRSLERHIRYGAPSSTLPGSAVRYGADVIVVGKNQSVLEEFFLGSITKKVVRSARTDVLVSHSH
jgi:nucleotide-binding universal stress UspA family protein